MVVIIFLHLLQNLLMPQHVELVASEYVCLWNQAIFRFHNKGQYVNHLMVKLHTKYFTQPNDINLLFLQGYLESTVSKSTCLYLGFAL